MITKVDKQIITKQITIKELDSGVALLYFDAPGKVNHLTKSVLAEFEQVLDWLENNADIKAIGILSGKPDTFLLGADIREIMKLESAEAAYELASQGQHAFNRLAKLDKPSVVGIHGSCLGGGLELALACNKRIASNSPLTELGLPEVKLGFVPGLGGTQRLPRLLPLKEALDLIISAEPISAANAFKLGILDQIVDHSQLAIAVEKAALSLTKSNEEIKKEALDTNERKQESIFSALRRAVRIRTKGRYPAPSRAIDVIEYGLKHGIDKGLEEEAKAFAELAVSDISRNLVSLYFSTEFARASAASNISETGENTIKTIGIIGGGLMGSGLARLAVLNDLKVLFRSVRKENTAIAQTSIRESLQRNRNVSSNEQSALDNFQVVENDEQFHVADLIFEAAEENLNTKVKIFQNLKPYLRQDCILATITSSLTVSDIQSQANTDNTLAAIHFFNPVERMPLVEIATAANADKAAIAKISVLIAKFSKIPLFVKDSPSFLVNRLLCVYLLEAACLAQEHIPLNWLEDAALDFGMPMGPLDLLDEVGLDTAVMVAETLQGKYGQRILLPAVLFKVKELGIKGKKAGIGIYKRDESGKKIAFDERLINNLNLVIADTKPDQAEINKLCERMILPMVDEAARCLEERIVRRPRDIDLAMVLGIGFPAFRGGLLKFADSIGISYVYEQLESIYKSSSGERKISDMIAKLAKENSKFYT